MPTLYQIIIVALLASFFVLFTTKTGLRDKARDIADKKGFILFGDMLDCDFCFCFWSSVAISVAMYIIFGVFSFLFVPVFSTPISRYLL